MFCSRTQHSDAGKAQTGNPRTRDKHSTTELPKKKKELYLYAENKCLSKPVTLLVKIQSLPVPVKTENLKENHKMLSKNKNSDMFHVFATIWRI